MRQSIKETVMPRFKHGTDRNQFEAAIRRSAESRRCPKCGRKSALKYLSGDEEYLAMTWCRWDDCDYVRYRERS
jgi:hypothetical protein